MYIDLKRFLCLGPTILPTIPSLILPKLTRLSPRDGWITETNASSRTVGQQFNHSHLGPVTVLEESEFWHLIPSGISLIVSIYSLAYAEMRLIATKVFWSFDMTMHESSTAWNIQKSYNIWERKPLMVNLSLAQH